MFLSRCRYLCWSCWLLIATVQCGPVPPESFLDTPCTTPDGMVGACVPVRHCKHVRYLIRRKHHNYQDTALLESLQCHGTPSVPGQQSLICCPRLTNDANCGGAAFANRIYGGIDSEIGEYPWLALLRFQERNGKLTVNCAGSLIGPRFVLSAVHCFRSRAGKPKQLKYVRLGEWNFQNHRGRSNCRKLDDGGVGREVCRKDYGVKRVALYPEYAVNAAAHLHDIALIELAEQVAYSEYIVPICLPLLESSESLSIPPIEYTAAGWGATLESDGMTPVLQAVDLLPYDKERCRKVYPVPSAHGIGDGHICAGGARGQDTCDGDSGGPLMQRIDGVAYLVGITSFGWPECGREGKPGVYTNVTHYLDWVAYEVLLGSRLAMSEVDETDAIWVV
ncbi:CLIP domain-containing serine protease B14-like [Anopheles albimanus]|uniref:CLIP domain-containing serine protease B14-like n=1 Tax=Anopheles albimanus TaxID=7167 RepID=UPI001640CA56|nr:CLIP domain-containing serine protease B14-like [Anopheles albimanus]XP_035789542.1 CLIP domain-containing serine protease B14-like [Anopheles albimanus]